MARYPQNKNVLVLEYHKIDWSLVCLLWIRKHDTLSTLLNDIHCVKSVQIRRFFWSVFSPNTGKYKPEKTTYFDTFHAVIRRENSFVPKKSLWRQQWQKSGHSCHKNWVVVYYFIKYTQSRLGAFREVTLDNGSFYDLVRGFLRTF